MKVNRYIEWFKKDNEGLIVGEEQIDISLKELQKEFKVSEKNPMYDCWEIKDENLNFFIGRIKHKIDLSKYVYYVSAYSIDE